MTDLKLLVLSILAQRGPQSDMALWGHTHHCQALVSIVMATTELENEGLIARSPFSRNLFPARVVGHELITYWQLSEKGHQFMPAPKEAHAGTC
jgi:DNA repair exonuclease SbcCD nuclease subunit